MLESLNDCVVKTISLMGGGLCCFFLLNRYF